ncbi:hypothetical protein Sste5346_008273 [Sporothrix stenoceras]|uniref:Zn(2)-C6 fungal-type domain-containing protein n=1 Tax=Sporothrix stenoceras TaxID=5173 RepID=A0ABR3YRG5_9PEZI
MTAPQVCTRCRKRRIRCDLQLPACKNCRLADVECFFWDNALGQEMPCSYLYSLRQRVAGLKRDMEAIQARQKSSTATVPASVSTISLSTLDLEGAALSALADLSQGLQCGGAWSRPAREEKAGKRGDYHLLRSTPLVTDEGDSVGGDGLTATVPSQTAYLGPGSTARLAEATLNAAVDWHAAKGVQLPTSLQGTEEAEDPLQNVPLSLSSQTRKGILGMITSSEDSPPPLTILHDPRKEAELHTLVPLATQRVLLEHYSAVCGASSPCYDSLLPAEQEAALLQRAGSGSENPLKWASANRGTAGAYATTVVFAVATALAARDLKVGSDGGRMAALASRFRDDVQALVGVEVMKGSQDNAESTLSSLERTRWTATALATMVLCEMIQPTTSQMWDLLGAATSVLNDLREGYCLRHRTPESDADFVRLERTMLRMEARTSLHFRRPSPFCDRYLLGPGSFSGGSSELEWQQLLASSFTPASSVVIDDLVVLRSTLLIRQQLELQPTPPEHFLESLIPAPLQVLGVPPLTRASLADATAPLMSVQSASLYITLYPVAMSPDMIVKGDAAQPPSRLFQLSAAAACVLLNEFTRQNPRHRIVSLWMSAERIIEAGIIWVLYVLAQQNHQQLDIGTAMRPVLQASGLLASFASRWKMGKAHVEAWDTLVELMWGILG